MHKLVCMVTHTILLAEAKTDHEGLTGGFCCHPPDNGIGHLAHLLALNLREVGFECMLATSNTADDHGGGVSRPREMVWFGTGRGGRSPKELSPAPSMAPQQSCTSASRSGPRSLVVKLDGGGRNLRKAGLGRDAELQVRGWRHQGKLLNSGCCCIHQVPVLSVEEPKVMKQMPGSPSAPQNGEVEDNLEKRCFAILGRAVADFMAAVKKESKVLRT